MNYQENQPNQIETWRNMINKNADNIQMYHDFLLQLEWGHAERLEEKDLLEKHLSLIQEFMDNGSAWLEYNRELLRRNKSGLSARVDVLCKEMFQLERKVGKVRTQLNHAVIEVDDIYACREAANVWRVFNSSKARKDEKATVLIHYTVNQATINQIESHIFALEEEGYDGLKTERMAQRPIDDYHLSMGSHLESKMR